MDGNMLEKLQRIVVHARRIFIWKLRTINLHEKESETLTLAGWDNHLMQKYLAWRRSMLIVLIPFILSTVILDINEIIRYGQDEENGGFSGYTGLGIYVLLTPSVASLISFISIVLALKWWTNYKYTSKCVLFGWLVSLILPLIPALFPIDFLLAEDIIGGTDDGFLSGVRLTLGIGYALQVFPLVVSVPFGIVRGALRIRGLLPESSLPGWFVILMAPLCPILILAALFFFAQLFGNVLLIIGITFLTVAPLLYVIQRTLYTEVLTDIQQTSLEWTQRTIAILSSLGYIFLAIWANSAGLLPMLDETLLFILQWMTRNLTTGLAFSDSIFRVTLHQLRVDRHRLNQEQYFAEVDALLKSTENDEILNRDDITLIPNEKKVASGDNTSNAERHNGNDSDEDGEFDDIEVQDWTASKIPFSRGVVRNDNEESSIPKYQPATRLDDMGADPGLNPPLYPRRY